MIYEELIDEHKKSKTLRKYRDEPKKTFKKSKARNPFTISRIVGR